MKRDRVEAVLVLVTGHVGGHQFVGKSWSLAFWYLSFISSHVLLIR